MKPNIVVKEIMKLRGHNNRTLSEELGKPSHTYVANPLAREKGMRIDTFLEMVEAMGCEVVVRSKLADKNEWTITNE